MPPESRRDMSSELHPVTRFQVLNVQVSGLTPDLLLESVERWVADRKKTYVNAFAVYNILSCHDAPALADIANGSGLTLPDGMPIVWLGRLAGLNVSRCYGPDMMLRVIGDGVEKGYRHFLYGSTPATLAALEKRLTELYPGVRIVGKLPDPFRELTPEDIAAARETINTARPDIVWVGNGTPKQDYWVATFRSELEAPVLFAVGAAFAFNAGLLRQAPRWMMRMGLEWLFRLANEPSRLWRRYVIGNSRFIFLVLRQLVTRRPAPLGKVPPRDQ